MPATENGGEVLVHIGIDTVELGGDGFTKLANVGDKVEAGAPIIEVDWQLSRVASLQGNHGDDHQHRKVQHLQGL